MTRSEYLSDTDIATVFNQINDLKKQLQLLFKEKYNRVLPFAELLFDRWEKANDLGFGEGTSVYDSSVILGNVQVGKNTWIGPNTVLDGSGDLIIGDNCSISANVQIYSHDTVQWAITGGLAKYEYAKTVIGDNCYVAPNVVISKGVEIGDGCIIGVNSFVNKSFPKGTKIAGNPAKEI
jgi:acetyltransferase-like isoleucine patch superfamily enzyme